MMQPFVAALGMELGLTSKDIADIVWLALQMQDSDAGAELTTVLEAAPIEPEREARSRPASPDFVPPVKPEKKPEPEAQPKSAELHQPNTNQPSFGRQLALNVPDARSLREPLSLARSLKPLLRRVVSGWSTTLDEAATVERIADEQLWLPVLKPALEPWLDLALLVDESISMQIWHRTIAELQRLLSHYGVFRDVRVWGLMTDERGQVKLHPGIGPTARRQTARRPSELIDPSGRRLILVATDCVSSSWQDGTLVPALKLWASSGPLAIVQMLPEWLWSRTGLGFASAVKLQSLLPGAPNQQLMASEVSPWDETDLDAGIKVPVVTLEPEPFATWTEMVAGKGGVWSPGFVLEEAVSPNGQIPQLPAIATEGSAEQRVQRFRVTASPMARRLAGLLAAAPVISLPVVRIIQDQLLPESRQVHVAEVFLGGLLKPLGEIGLELSSDAVQYDFLDGVRELLLKSMPTSDVVDVVEEVSKFVATRLGLSLEAFSAVLRNPQQAKDRKLTNQSRPFAMVTAQILWQLGGEYLRFAEELEQAHQWDSLITTPQDFWKKLYTAFDPFRPLPANDPVWIDCASVRGGEDILQELGLEIARSQEVTCQLYTGHRGSGKSTELLRLQNHLQNQGFQVVYFAADDGDLEPEDTEYSDILLACARQLISKLRWQPGQDHQFREWVNRLLWDLQDLGVTELSLDELNVETPEISLSKIPATIKTNVSKRRVIRRRVEQQAESLIAILNDFIANALGDRKPQDLVLIVDNLDRIIEHYDGENKSNYERIFVDYSEQLRALKCHVIYTVPISLAYSVHLTVMEASYKPVTVLPMIMLKMPTGERSETGMIKLKELIRQRFRFAHVGVELDAAFETAEALEKLCEMSGGHMRNLMNLMKAALQHTRELPISMRSVQRAISELRDTYRKVIAGYEWEALVRVSQEKLITENDDLFRSLLFRRCILEYRYINDEGEVQVWHDVHPLVRELDGFKRASDHLGGAL